MSDVVNQFTISIDQVRDFEFRVQFDKSQYAAIHMDEGPPLGKDTAPSPARYRALACCSASRADRTSTGVFLAMRRAPSSCAAARSTWPRR